MMSSPRIKDERIDAIESILNSGDSELIASLIASLSRFKVAELCELADNSAKIKKFCRETPLLNSKWSSYLEQLHYPSKTIYPSGNGKPISTFNLLSGTFFFNKFTNSIGEQNLQRSIEYLNKACEDHLYHALVERINVNLKSVLDNSLTTDKFDDAVDNILRDVNDLSSNYWSMGYFKAADTLFQLATAYANLNNADSTQQAIKFMDDAWKCLFIAEDIRTVPASQALVETISAELAIYPSDDAFNDLSDKEGLVAHYQSKIPAAIKSRYSEERFISLQSKASEAAEPLKSLSVRYDG
jgi:hypothetical protein